LQRKYSKKSEDIPQPPYCRPILNIYGIVKNFRLCKFGECFTDNKTIRSRLKY